MKIIFLDIDGVLNGYNYWNLLAWDVISRLPIKGLKKLCIKIFDPWGIHKSKVKRLGKIVRKTGAKVVMSSCWRFAWWKTPYEKMSDEQKKLTNLFKKYGIEVIDITPKSITGRRDREIITWLSRHEEQIDKFIILDDERFDLECFVGSNLIQTSSVLYGETIMGMSKEDTGLKRKHVKEAIKILNSKHDTYE